MVGKQCDFFILVLNKGVGAVKKNTLYVVSILILISEMVVG